jgi:hypothetical protein
MNRLPLHVEALLATHAWMKADLLREHASGLGHLRFTAMGSTVKAGDE